MGEGDQIILTPKLFLPPKCLYFPVYLSLYEITIAFDYKSIHIGLAALENISDSRSLRRSVS